MLRALLTFALSRRPIILLGMIILLGGGLIAFSKLNIEAYPNPAPVILEITAQAPGVSAEEMERYYTIPMEVGLASTPGVEVIRSTSFYGLSFVRVRFKYGVDYYFAKMMASVNLQQNVNLPNNVSPTIQGSSLVGEIFRYELVGPPHFGLTNLRTLQDWVLQRRLLTVPGVVQVVTWGGTTKTYDVEVGLHKLDAYSITLPQMLTAIGNANINVGGRTINVGEQSVNVRGVGLIGAAHDPSGLGTGGDQAKVEDIEQIVLSVQAGGIPVLVKDVAKVSVGYLPRLGKAGRDENNDVVTGIVVMDRTLHTNDVVARVQAAIQKLNSDGTLPPGVHVVPFYDRATLVSVTTHTVVHNLIFGCLLVFAIQWMFLGNFRSAIIVGANIPFALLFSVMILYAMGESANLLSVGAVDFGIIVDSCVILVENVFRNFQLPEDQQRAFLKDHGAQRMGWSERMQMIYAGGLQVEKGILFSTAITLAAFVPLFTMQGVEGQIFSPMARTYGYALVGALLATFTVTPVLASLLLPAHVRETETIVVRALRAVYQPVLHWALSRRTIMVLIGIGFLVSAVLLVPRLGGEFLPVLEEGNLWIRVTMPPTISLEAGMPKVDRMRQILLSHPEVVTVVSQHGRPDDGSDAAGFYNAEFFAPLKPMDQWTPGLTKDKLIEDIQKEFTDDFLGITFNFSQYIQDNIQEGLSGIKGANSIKIIGRDLATLEHIATQVLSVMDQVKGISDLGVFRVLGQPNLNITVDRENAARYGLNVGDVNTMVQGALGGAQATTVLEGERQFALLVRVAPEYRASLEKVRGIKVGFQTSSGPNAYIPLSELATITLDTGASYIYHERNQRFIPIKFSVRGRDLEGAVADAEEQIARKVKLPEGYRIEWAGEFEELQQAKKRLEVIVPLSLVLIMVLLYGLFNSVGDSLLALAGIPFAVAGGVLALFVTGLHFSISAAIGFVSLFGISVMDGILMITYYNEVMLRGGLSSLEGMFHAASQRMRPMLMTALSACIGLFPAAISTGIGSQVQRPLATVVVGGLLIGPLMLLVVVPPLRLMFLGRDDGSAAPQGQSPTTPG
ncbi:MAG TPA: CusA/CzcA family heavy metal efflux RND transporter [Nitrospiraceae bacterium]|nr:CusA/CzcA family heavy metal efflux RND transporter [Nitrospiraceae bacterium]